MAQAELHLRFSVIIPLEFHRGLAERCIRGWSQNQTFARENYEILVAAPDDHDPEELRQIAELLGGPDRILKFPFRHDMALVAEAAENAQGTYLVLTESHCLPEPDFLQRAEDVLRERPEWSGFSGRSVPITHNLLSEIEAEMYHKDITNNLLRHEWLKVLDQCFVISRDGYCRAGGLEPEYGHFAEWLFAARCHRAGVLIGYDARPAVRHYYVGDLAELEEFTEDFSKGQMLFASRSECDPCADLFDEVPEWRARHELDPRVVGIMLGILWKDLSLRCLSRRTGDWLESLRLWPWGEVVFWFGKTRLFKKLLEWRREREIASTRDALTKSLARGNKAAATEEFLRLMGHRVKRARTGYLAKTSSGAGFLDDAVLNHSEWRPGRFEKLAAVGMHALERHGRVNFRWSRPVAVLQLPRLAGPVRVKIEWAVPHDRRTRFYLVGRGLAPIEAKNLGDNFTELFVCEGTANGVLALVSERLAAPNDERSLGVAVASVCCRSVPVRHSRGDSNGPLDATYFLHVPKCAGTTTRLLLAGSLCEEDILAAAEPEFYYAKQLLGNREIHTNYKLAAGHFRWDLPSMVPNRKWRVVTALRHPANRLLSLHQYLIQMRKLPSDSGLGEWFSDRLLVKDLSIGHFVPSRNGSHAAVFESGQAGARAVAELAESICDEAVANLKTCAVVGLHEQMDSTVNLLSWKLGLLPPEVLPCANPTLLAAKSRRDSSEVEALVEKYLGRELDFYALAVELFERQIEEMHNALYQQGATSREPDAVRNFLRKNFFEREARRPANAAVEHFEWTAGQGFMGIGLHQHERHGGVPLRWTGLSSDTVFYAPLNAARRIALELRLHPATPKAHADSCAISINGVESVLRAEESDDGYVLRSDVEFHEPPPFCAPFTEAKLNSKRARFPWDSRELGIALTRVSFRCVHH